MPREYKKYCCNICEREYEYYSQAIACELRGIPKPRFKIGEIVTAKWVRWPNRKYSRAAKIMRLGFNDHKIISYAIEFLDSQDRPDDRQIHYDAYDNLESTHGRDSFSILLYRRRK